MKVTERGRGGYYILVGGHRRKRVQKPMRQIDREIDRLVRSVDGQEGIWTDRQAYRDRKIDKDKYIDIYEYRLKNIYRPKYRDRYRHKWRYRNRYRQNYRQEQI